VRKAFAFLRIFELINIFSGKKMFLYLLAALPIFVFLRRTVFKPERGGMDQPPPTAVIVTGQVGLQ
jgi:hypothetical protein